MTIRRQPAGVLRRPVPERLTALLRHALALERAARGEQRIPAFRLTRSLLAGARFAGYTDAQVAKCLDISVGAVRSRGGTDGWVTVEDFVALADLAPDTADQWAQAGLLAHTATDELGRRHHPASELIRALDDHVVATDELSRHSPDRRGGDQPQHEG